MDGIQYGYDELINAVFEDAYDNLVSDYRRTWTLLNDAKSYSGAKRMDTLKDAEGFAKEAVYLESWFRQTLPKWRSIAPDRIIKRAKEEALEPRERKQSALHSRFNRGI